MKIIIIGLGGFFGAIIRYLMSFVIQHVTKNISVPLGTFFVNVTGCFLIAFFSCILNEKFSSQHLQPFVLIGFLGSYTTFSTFTIENYYLIKNHQWLEFFSVFVLQLIVGFLMVYLGFLVAKKFITIL